MNTATYEPLFIQEINQNEVFEKEASIARMPDDDKKWPEVVLSELHKQLPFMSGMDVSLNFTRIQPEAGYGFGYALVRGQKNAIAIGPKDENQMVKIPLIVADRHLEPFHVFHFEGKTIPLTKSRFEEALENPRMFAGPSSTPKTQKSLIDQLYPPYQQRQGFGRVVDSATGVSGSSMGINKVAASVEDMSPGQIKRLAKLKQYQGIDRANSSISSRDRLKTMADNTSFSAGTGAAMGGIKHILANRASGVSAKGLGKATLTGALTGGALSLAGQGYKAYKAKKRQEDRLAEPYKQHFKEALAEDIPNLRMSESEDVKCKTCTFYGSSTKTGEGMCNKYSSDVKEAMVCDSWEANTAPDKLASYTKYLMGAKI